MADFNKFDPRVDSLVIETKTIWDTAIGKLADADIHWLADAVHRHPEKASNVEEMSGCPTSAPRGEPRRYERLPEAQRASKLRLFLVFLLGGSVVLLGFFSLRVVLFLASFSRFVFGRLRGSGVPFRSSRNVSSATLGRSGFAAIRFRGRDRLGRGRGFAAADRPNREPQYAYQRGQLHGTTRERLDRADTHAERGALHGHLQGKRGSSRHVAGVDAGLYGG